MKKRLGIVVVLGALIFGSISATAQSKLAPDVMQMQESAQHYIEQKDYSNGIMLLSQAIRRAPDNVSLRRDLAYAYYLTKDYQKAKEIIDPVVNSDVADEQTYQIAAATESALSKKKDAEKILKKGIKNFPNSGLLYNNLGSLYQSDQRTKAAETAWSKGLEVEPGYPLNYYNLAKLFSEKQEYVWTLVYGETYVNLDNDPIQTNEIKRLIIEAYKGILSLDNTTDDLPKFRNSNQKKSKNLSFETAYKNVLMNHSVVLRNGLDVESLSMLRTQFLMEWQTKYASRFPSSLLNWENDIIYAGGYDAYNQWLFGAVMNSQSFANWVKQFNDYFTEFQKWKDKHPYRPSLNDPRPS